MTLLAEVQVGRKDGWLPNDRIRLTDLLRKGPAPAGPFYLARPAWAAGHLRHGRPDPSTVGAAKRAARVARSR